MTLRSLPPIYNLLWIEMRWLGYLPPSSCMAPHCARRKYGDASPRTRNPIKRPITRKRASK
jgi:hypothetical protein